MAVGLLCVVAASPAWAKMPEKPEGHISDFAEMLTEDEEAALTKLSRRVEGVSGAQMMMVTVTSLDGKSVQEYASNLFRLWGIGRKDGVLLLVALNEQAAHIEAGHGLESVLDGAKARQIVDEAVVPRLKVREYYTAILAGSERIGMAIAGDAALKESAPAQPAEAPIPPAVTISVAAVLGLMITFGCFCFGAGFRGNIPLIFWGTLFGGVPGYLATVLSPAWGISGSVVLTLGILMVLIGLLFGKNAASRIKVSVGVKAGGRSSSRSGTSSEGSGFGGGTSGGGGTGGSW